MKYKKHSQDAGLFDYQERVDELKQRSTALDKRNKTVDWELFRPVLEKQMNRAGARTLSVLFDASQR